MAACLILRIKKSQFGVWILVDFLGRFVDYLLSYLLAVKNVYKNIIIVFNSKN